MLRKLETYSPKHTTCPRLCNFEISYLLFLRALKLSERVAHLRSNRIADEITNGAFKMVCARLKWLRANVLNAKQRLTVLPEKKSKAFRVS